MRKLRKLWDYFQQAAPDRSIPFQIADIVAHKLRINTCPGDYYRFGFYRKQLSWEEKSRYIGQFGSMYWPYELNPCKCLVTLTNKYIFKNLARGFGLPTPKLISTIGRFHEVRTRTQLEALLRECSRDIVLKPISSAGGHRIVVLERAAGGFARFGEPVEFDRIWEHVQTGWDMGFLVEERVRNHPQYSDLHPDSLNCFRVVTLRLQNGEQRFINWGLKVGRDRLQVDNAGAGGIWIVFDRLGKTTAAFADYLRTPITHHPNTERPLVGLRLEEVDAVFALAETASNRFSMMGTIGWDIALTDQGPMIIEGNTLWGGEAQILQGGMITDEMAADLTRHRAFGRWNRSCMYPGMDRRRRRAQSRKNKKKPAPGLPMAPHPGTSQRERTRAKELGHADN